MFSTERGPWFGYTWVFAAVLLLGVLAGCTEQSGSKGPTTPAAGQSGDTDAGVAVTLGSKDGPGAAQFIITAIVQSLRGRPIAGSSVTFVITAGLGEMNPARATTDRNGEASSVLNCRGTGNTTVTVLVEGAVVGGGAAGVAPNVSAACP